MGHYEMGADNTDFFFVEDEPPRRIQRKRAKGWKMPPNTVYVGRPSKWGNPWKTAPAYSGWLAGTDFFWLFQARRMKVLGDISELRGKDLACWCPLDQPCHADVLLELANR
jgi:hypothetical protein